MKLLVITHTPHWEEDGLWAYGPYIREMNLWFNPSDEVVVVAPMGKTVKSKIHNAYDRKDIRIRKIAGVSLVSFRESIKTLCKLPRIVSVIYSEMRKADHIHLRCPGNIGLIGAMVQLLFPGKPKTVKYAGNWDPQSKQPLSYRIQKRIIGSTSLSKNMKVLVYGEWSKQSQNIVPFFTASYREQDKAIYVNKLKPPFRFMFVGSLVSGKRPEYAISLVKHLREAGEDVTLDIYGDGALRNQLEKKALNFVNFRGNQKAAIVQQAYKENHFLILPSKSEGWPKVVAEAMFYGTIPLVTPISCVPWMLDQGERGVLLSLDLEEDASQVSKVLKEQERSLTMSTLGQEWSQKYTLETFEEAIKELLR